MSILCNITGKVYSKDGVSMPLALLLFLVCALLASVVLAASTAVGGRHVQLAESDQRYYSVASAVELFQKEFENTPVNVQCEVTKTVTTVANYGGATTSSEKIDACTVTVDGKTLFTGTGAGTITATGLSLIEQTAVTMLCGGTSFDPATTLADDTAAYATTADIGDCTITPTITGVDNTSQLVVTMEEKLLEGGRVQMRFDSVPGTGRAANTGYSLTLVCDADIDIDESTEEGPVTMTTTGTTRTETQVVKTVRTVTVRFTTTELGNTFENTVAVNPDSGDDPDQAGDTP